MNNIRLWILFFTFFSSVTLRADEGMWIPCLLEQLNENEMHRMGLRLTAEDIYSINHSSLKDAVLLFGSGCTAEIVSGQGLNLTNHHCGYSAIQSHSSLEHDYLTNGFWAMRQDEELSNPGLTVELLVWMEEVTEKVLTGITDQMTEYVRDSLVEKNITNIISQVKKEKYEEARVKPFNYGNQYFLFVTEVFRDIRLVGTPPNSIGKFGGDTDNWMWPRHTGDFSVFRVYAGKDNHPAAYSPDNVPYQPKKYLTVSLKGYEMNDFTFVYGYPGRTQQFLTSWGVDLVTAVENPARIALRGKRLEVIDHYMEKSPLTRIQYSARAASIANGWKKWIGESNGLKRLETAKNKKIRELEFQSWVIGDPKRKERYQTLLREFEKTYHQMTPLDNAYIYFSEAGQGIELLRFAARFKKLVDLSQLQHPDPKLIREEVEKLKGGITGFFKNYCPEIDKETMPYLLKEYADNTEKNYLPDIFSEIQREYDVDYQQYTESVFRNSIFADETALIRLMEAYRASRYRKIKKDPAFKLAESINRVYTEKIQDPLYFYRTKIDSLQRLYVRALMEGSPGKRFYPDANLTLRVAYGKVDDYSPRDAVDYQYYTTLGGILEKEDSTIYDYVVLPRLKSLYETRDFGPYADKDGEMHTAFIATNHTTGGNSGSPVFNADGQLIGINFDRNWEGTMSDINYDPDQCRNIALDIRYCLFVIDKVCGAGHLVQEMNIVR